MHEEQKERKQKVVEERRLAGPNNYHDVRQMEPGSRRAEAKPAGCGGAAWLRSDWAAQCWGEGGYKPVHAD